MGTFYNEIAQLKDESEEFSSETTLFSTKNWNCLFFETELSW